MTTKIKPQRLDTSTALVDWQAIVKDTGTQKFKSVPIPSTTWLLSSVAHDTSLTGSGTSGDPLSVMGWWGNDFRTFTSINASWSTPTANSSSSSVPVKNTTWTWLYQIRCSHPTTSSYMDTYAWISISPDNINRTSIYNNTTQTTRFDTAVMIPNNYRYRMDTNNVFWGSSSVLIISKQA